MSTPPQPTTGSRSGVAASLGASVLFGGTFVLPPMLLPLDPEQVLGYRLVVTLAFLALLFVALGAWTDVASIVRRCRARPHLAGVLVVDALLLGPQLWLFGWAPQTGHGLEVSLGYLVLPLVMVLVGVVVYQESLSLLRGLAVLSAAVGVGAAVLLTGGLGWPTLLVALGFPVYFVLRRTFGLNTAGAPFLELAAMLPFTAAVWLAKPSFDVLTDRPALVLGLLLLGLVSAGGFTLYLTASRVLPFALFGVLGYVEPVLLVVVSLAVFGEPWQPADTFTYLPICLGLALLVVDLRGPRRSRRQGTRVPSSVPADPR